MLVAVTGLALLAIGAIYLTVECQSLPGFMGSVHGDTSPRTGLGIVFVAIGVMVAGTGLALARRRWRG
jgi:hypothetical protein